MGIGERIHSIFNRKREKVLTSGNAETYEEMLEVSIRNYLLTEEMIHDFAKDADRAPTPADKETKAFVEKLGVQVTYTQLRNDSIQSFINFMEMMRAEHGPATPWLRNRTQALDIYLASNHAAQDYWNKLLAERHPQFMDKIGAQRLGILKQEANELRDTKETVIGITPC